MVGKGDTLPRVGADDLPTNRSSKRPAARGMATAYARGRKNLWMTCSLSMNGWHRGQSFSEHCSPCPAPKPKYPTSSKGLTPLEHWDSICFSLR